VEKPSGIPAPGEKVNIHRPVCFRFPDFKKIKGGKQNRE